MRHALNKVPEITILFWIIKILTTGMGETTSDFLVKAIDPGVAVGMGAAGLAIALVIQFRIQQYVPWVYWLTVVMVAVFGTMAADVLHVGLGIPYVISSTFFSVALVVIFCTWYFTEHTVSIHSINTVRRELFYWATVITTFALGTAVGDMTATTLRLGYFSSGVLFTGLILLVTLVYYSALLLKRQRQSYNAVLAFWLAYILTRPLGASFADWMGVSHARGGLDWGTGWVSLVLAFFIGCFVAYLSATRKNTALVR